MMLVLRRPVGGPGAPNRWLVAVVTLVVLSTADAQLVINGQTVSSLPQPGRSPLEVNGAEVSAPVAEPRPPADLPPPEDGEVEADVAIEVDLPSLTTPLPLPVQPQDGIVINGRPVSAPLPATVTVTVTTVAYRTMMPSDCSSVRPVPVGISGHNSALFPVWSPPAPAVRPSVTMVRLPQTAEPGRVKVRVLAPTGYYLPPPPPAAAAYTRTGAHQDDREPSPTGADFSWLSPASDNQGSANSGAAGVQHTTIPVAGSPWRTVPAGGSYSQPWGVMVPPPALSVMLPPPASAQRPHCELCGVLGFF